MTNLDVEATTVLASAEEIPAVLRQLRGARGLSQRELARRVQTKASVICRLENPMYRGHSLEMLKRIGEVLGMEIAVQFASQETLKAESGAAEVA